MSSHVRGSLRLALALPLFLALSLRAADPPSGTVSKDSPTVSWSGQFVTPTGGACGSDSNPACDNFKLTIVPPSTADGPYAVEITLLPVAGDWDLEVYGPDGGFVDGSGNAAGQKETVLLTNSPAGGTYTVVAAPFAPAPASPSYTAQAVLKAAPPRPAPAPLGSGLAPRYQNHAPTPAQLAAGMGAGSGEPSIGVNRKSGKVMYEGGIVQTLRVTFQDSCATTPRSIWEDKSAPTSAESFDPILFTDVTGRTFVSQLALAGSLSSYSDNDGDVWIPSQGAGIPSGQDHQTVGGGGPFHAPVPTGAGYPNPLYYCAQHIINNGLQAANCAVSLDGGLTYGPAMTVYTPDQCGGLHGHLKVGPDGTAYLPNKDCGGNEAVVVSEDNGINWDVRKVPGSSASNSDPSVAISRGGRVYLGFAHADNYPVVAVSDDRGKTWDPAKTFDVGASLGIRNVVFPAMVAGDDDRAAFAFLGTTANGNLQDPRFPGIWHLYVAHTYDGGKSWITVDATPNDPVQRGCVWLQGGANICRNLLDFMDATLDAEGRMLVGYADGCADGCVQAPAGATGNGYTANAAIARQTGGRHLLSQFDPAEPTAPGAPALAVTRNGGVAHLTWSESENGGSAITGYRVYRGTASGAGTLLANAGTASRFDDTTVDGTTTYFYSVTATNAYGTSCGSDEVASAPVGGSCTLPGVRVASDATGDQVGAPLNAGLDFQSISIAEPYFADGSRKLVLTMKVADLSSVPANAEWRLFWNSSSAPFGIYYVGMSTDDSSNVTFEYGTAQVQVVGLVLGVPVTTTVGAPDAASYKPDGTIAITVSVDKVGSPRAGDILGGVFARSFILTGNTTTRSTTAIDVTPVGSPYVLVGNAACAPPAVACLEDDDAHIAYANGWHLVQNSGASAGHFRVNLAKGSATLAFDVPAGRLGAVTYNYAKSTKGGSAEVFLDGVSKGVVGYAGSTGAVNAPQFGFNVRYSGLKSGSHTLEIRPIAGAVYVDGFCVENASSNAQPASGPGQTSSSTSSVGAGAQLLQQLAVPSGTQALSVVAVPSAAIPVQLVLVDPSGSVLGTADSASGLAVIQIPVSKSGTYVVKVTNLGVGPVQVWTASTPLVAR
jgi:hypothetical protein